jgi:universal stress protein E
VARSAWKSILVAIADPYREQQLALRKATAIAERSGARITLFNAFKLPSPPSGSKVVSSQDVVQAAIDERTQRLRHLARALEKRGIATGCVVKWDFPTHEAIVRAVMEEAPDVVFAESHHHNFLARMLLANTDWELIRACPCPVLFVKSRSLPKAPQVLVAVDPRHAQAKAARLDDRLIAAANRLVDQLGGTVSIAHVYEPSSSGSGAARIEPMRWSLSAKPARDFDATTRKLVDDLAARHSVRPANRILQTGDAVHVLPAIAKKLKADVLIMGAVSRSRLERPFIGNTAEKVIDHVECDVLVVKPASFKTSVRRARVKV